MHSRVLGCCPEPCRRGPLHRTGTGSRQLIAAPLSTMPPRRREATGAKHVAAASAASSSGGPTRSWDSITNTLVGASSIPFSILVLPQVYQNLANMTSNNAAALSIISWEGYLSAAFGNTLMCSHFASKGERSAVNVQLIGIANNFLILTQVALAGFMPGMTYLAAAIFTASAVAITLWHFAATTSGQSQQPAERLSLWNMWQLGAGLVGLAVVPQVLYNTVAPAAPTMVPFLASLALLSVYFLAKVLGRVSGATVDTINHLPGWAATALFALSPLPQLVRNLLDATSLEGLSVGTMVLALLGNALMVPRALLTRDAVWLTGTLWACTAGWGQLLTMYLRRSPSTGLPFVDPTVFFAVTAVLASFCAYVFQRDAQSRSELKPKAA